jgi:MOSC domain-containing protein YiiM
MSIVSLNVGLPRDVVWHGKTVSTGIYKAAVEGRVPLRRLNLDGDRQADLSVHGGAFKAVYCYPSEHYRWWTQELGGRDLAPGMFGENFTVEGLDEESVHIGDQFSIGTTRVIVTQPRMPCYKLGIRFQSDGMVRRFLASGRTGFYLAVEREGHVAAGDAITLVGRDPHGVRVADITRLHVARTFGRDDLRIARRALDVAALPERWKDDFRDRLVTASRA